MPLYTYLCETCGAELEILHGLGKTKTSCGLDCKRRDAGPFGKGTITLQLSAANVASPATEASFADVKREALRQKALRKLGGELTERDLDKLRDKGIAVYRKDGKDGWSNTGGGRNGKNGRSAPAQIKKPKDD